LINTMAILLKTENLGNQTIIREGHVLFLSAMVQRCNVKFILCGLMGAKFILLRLFVEAKVSSAQALKRLIKNSSELPWAKAHGFF